jgi:hypothetical protein
MWQRSFIGLSLLLATASLAAHAQSTASSQGPNRPAASTVQTRAVLELFTSQGCSSCPAADTVLEHYTKQPGILALSFAVDYWDYLGWKDTLANQKFTHRQKYYAKMRGDGQVYTPQVIINGLAHTNGADRRSIERAVADTEKARAARWVPVSMVRNNGQVTINAGALPDAKSSSEKAATLWLVTFARRVEVAVKRGENAGKSLAYVNVVREMTAVGMWHGEALSVQLDGAAITQPGADGFAVILQAGQAGPIIGAAVLPQ